MSDSNPVDVTDNLDEFSKILFSKDTLEKAPEDKEVVEDVPETPSATEEDDSKEESEVEESAEKASGEDAPADEDDSDPEIEEEDTSLLKVKSKKSARERINELTAQKRDAERRADALARELEEARSKDQPKVRQEPTTPDRDAPDPDTLLEDGKPMYPLGEFDPHFISDLTRFTISKEMAAAKQEAEEARAVEEMEKSERELLGSWADKIKVAVERLPDLPEKVSELEDTFRNLDPNYGKYLASTIMSLEFGPDVLDYLADHPDEARKIASSGATQATIALGRIEARFIKPAEKEVEKGKVVTQAPPPPVRNKGSATKHAVADDTDDLDAFTTKFYS